MSALLVMKLLLVPGLIWAVTLVGRRWGAAVAGWLSAFPLVAGPILLVIGLEQGPGFAGRAAEGTLLAVLAILVFSLSYAWTAQRFGLLLSMCSALFCYALAVLLLQGVQWPLALSFALVILALAVTPRGFPPAAPEPVAPGARQVRSDLPWRMLAAAALVLGVTSAAAQLGPRLSGLLAMFPIMSTVLVGFSHHFLGRGFAIELLRGMVYGYFAFASFCVLLALLLPQHALLPSFSAAVAVAVLVQWAGRRLLLRSPAAKRQV